MSECVEVRKQRAAFLALELPESREREVRAHLRGCDSCRSDFVGEDPVLAFSLRMPEAGISPADEDEFVQGVLAGIRHRTTERRLRRWRSGWWAGAAAAVLVVVALGSGRARLGSWRDSRPANVDRHELRAGGPMEPALIEVEGRGVRLYQLTTGGDRPVAVAFVVDPNVEL